MIGLLRTLLVQILAVALLSVGSPLVVQAEVIGTLVGLESAQRDADLARVNRVLATAEAREQLQALGVDQAQVEARLAGLTDSELGTLAANCLDARKLSIYGGANEVQRNLIAQAVLA